MELHFVHVLSDQAFIAGHEASAVLDPVYWSADLKGGPEAYDASLAPFSEAQRRFLGVGLYASEVDNGGHDQFYWNSTGIVWRDALAGLEMLGLAGFANVLRESARRMGGDPSGDRAARHAVLDEREPDFSDLDDYFYELEDGVDLDDRMTAWMRAHPDEFLFEGVVQKPLPR